SAHRVVQERRNSYQVVREEAGLALFLGEKREALRKSLRADRLGTDDERIETGPAELQDHFVGIVFGQRQEERSHIVGFLHLFDDRRNRGLLVVSNRPDMRNGALLPEL